MFFFSAKFRFNLICGFILLLLCSGDVFASSESEINFIIKQLRQQNRPIPRESVLKEKMLERLIQKRLQLQLAEKAHINIADETLDNAILNIASQNNMSLTQFRDALESDGYAYATYRNIIRDEITINQLRQRQVVNRIKVTEQETQDFLSNKALQGNHNDEYRVAHILIEVPEAASSDQVQQAKQKAQAVLDELVNGEDFSQLAAAASDGQKALEGGDLGWRKLGQLPVLFSNVVTTMEINGVSTLIRSPSGFHIIKLTDKRANVKKQIIVQTKARHILVKVDELTTDYDARQKLEQLKRRIDLGDNFEEVARSNSDDPGSAANGGSLGWVSPGVMVPQFEKQMDKLDIGQMSEPFKTQFGWHIIHVQERRDYDNTEEFNIMSAKRQIRERKIEEETQNWLRRLRDEAYVEIRI
jgi:peptidyl-prolyl cis-trans isomerase SurA